MKKSILFPYFVEFRCRRTHFNRSEEEYGSWSESYSNSFVSIEKNSSPNLVSSLDLKVGEKAFLVWVEYSHGDSFGCSHRGNVMPIALFKDRECAEALKNDTTFWTPENDPTNIESSRQCRFSSPDGQTITYSYPEWDDYFGGLEEVHVEEVVIREGYSEGDT